MPSTARNVSITLPRPCLGGRGDHLHAVAMLAWIAAAGRLREVIARHARTLAVRLAHLGAAATVARAVTGL